jgi:hypothetical protein
MLTRPVAFDAVELRTDEEGRFAFDALPPESLEVTPPSRDHHLDPATPGLDARQRASLRIADAGDVELDLRMLAGAPAAPGRRPSAQPRDTTRTGPPNH